MKYLFACLLGIFTYQAIAGQIERLNVQYHDGTYTVEAVLLINVRQQDAWNIITDYENLNRINPAIIKSEILLRSENHLKYRLITESCILFFCKHLTIVEDVVEKNGTTIHTIIDPEQSDFELGETEWHIQPEGTGQTRVYYQKKIKPNFWVPPVIGPALVKLKIRNEIKNSIRQVEVLLANE